MTEQARNEGGGLYYPALVSGEGEQYLQRIYAPQHTPEAAWGSLGRPEVEEICREDARNEWAGDPSRVVLTSVQMYELATVEYADEDQVREDEQALREGVELLGWRVCALASELGVRLSPLDSRQILELDVLGGKGRGEEVARRIREMAAAPVEPSPALLPHVLRADEGYNADGEAELHERAEAARVEQLNAESEPPYTAALFEDE